MHDEFHAHGVGVVVGLAVADTILVLLLTLLVAGLLRSHADIARKLRELGVPLGDPAREPRQIPPTSARPRRSRDGMIEIGPLLPHRPVGTSVFDLEGASPDGDGLAVAVTGARRTLLCFLSSGCASCGAIWADLDSRRLPIPDGVRTVVVTKGPEAEQVSSVQRLAPRGGDIPVVMSSQAWRDYDVPGSPFFVFIDGEAGRRLGEGTARSLDEVAELVLASIDDAAAVLGYSSGRRVGDTDEAGHRRRDHVATVDEELAAAGIRPGDASLYPASVDDLVRSPDAKPPHRAPVVPVPAPPTQ